MVRKRHFLRGRHRPDLVLLGALLLLLAFGVLTVYDASVVTSLDLFGGQLFGGQYHYLILQLAWVLLGLFPAIFFYLLDYRRLRGLALPLFLFSLICLVFVLLPISFNPEMLGARRWIYLNPAPMPKIPLLVRLKFQPSELAKLGLVLFSAALFVGRRKVTLRLLLPLLFLVTVPVILEPDLGTAVILAGIGMATYFVAGGSLLQLVLFLPLLLAAAVSFILVSPYRSERLFTYLNPSLADPRGAGYQIRQILIALGSGGLFGMGIGEGRQKYAYLPGVNTDSIFAVVGEEFGFVGSVVLLFLFWLVIYRGFRVAQRAPDQFGKVLAGGITSWFALQTLINLGSMVRIIPLTGVTLPLISYGGSSLIVTMAALGILLNISKQMAIK